MATLESDEANIVDAAETNWRLIIYPLLAVLVVVVGGLAVYYYQQTQRQEREQTARTALLKATTPAQMLDVAKTYAGTDQAMLADISAADASFQDRKFDDAAANYQQVVDNHDAAPDLRDSASLGQAAALEAGGKGDRAIGIYMDVARRGAKSPFAPFAFNALSRLYEERGAKDEERKTLVEAVRLDPDSTFTKQAQSRLKELTVVDQPPATVNAPNASAPQATAPAPSPAK